MEILNEDSDIFEKEETSSSNIQTKFKECYVFAAICTIIVTYIVFIFFIFIHQKRRIIDND